MNDKVKGTVLFVATPMFGGMCYSGYALALSDLSVSCAQYGIPLRIKVINNDAFIHNARNILAHSFLESNATHLLFIDADVSFSHNDALSLIEADKDVIAGIYPKKTIEWDRVERAVKAGIPQDQLKHFTARHTFAVLQETTEVNIEEPLEVQTAATGFMMIKRRVFECLADKVEKYKHPDYKDPLSMFFNTEIHNGSLYSEDNYFCRLYRKHGGKIFIAPWVNLAHTGTFTFQGRLTHI